MKVIGVQPPTALADAWTWEQYLEASAEVKKANGNYAFSYGWSGPDTTYRWMPLICQNGGASTGQDGITPSMDSDAAIEALAFGRRWCVGGLVSLSNLSKSGGGTSTSACSPPDSWAWR